MVYNEVVYYIIPLWWESNGHSVRWLEIAGQFLPGFLSSQINQDTHPCLPHPLIQTTEYMCSAIVASTCKKWTTWCKTWTYLVIMRGVFEDGRKHLMMLMMMIRMMSMMMMKRVVASWIPLTSPLWHSRCSQQMLLSSSWPRSSHTKSDQFSLIYLYWFSWFISPM